MRERIIEILEENCPGIEFENETALIDDGVIESLDIVMIVSDFMNEFDIELNVEDLIPENFNSVDAMEELIKEKMI